MTNVTKYISLILCCLHTKILRFSSMCSWLFYYLGYYLSYILEGIKEFVDSSSLDSCLLIFLRIIRRKVCIRIGTIFLSLLKYMHKDDLVNGAFSSETVNNSIKDELVVFL